MRIVVFYGLLFVACLSIIGCEDENDTAYTEKTFIEKRIAMQCNRYKECDQTHFFDLYASVDDCIKEEKEKIDTNINDIDFTYDSVCKGKEVFDAVAAKEYVSCMNKASCSAWESGDLCSQYAASICTGTQCEQDGDCGDETKYYCNEVENKCLEKYGIGYPCSGDGTICDWSNQKLLRCQNGGLVFVEDCAAKGVACQDGECAGPGNNCTGTGSSCSGDKIVVCIDGSWVDSTDCAAQNKSCVEEANGAVCQGSSDNDSETEDEVEIDVINDADSVNSNCGNDKTDIGEACDGDAKDCTTIPGGGYTGGFAECKKDCTGYDTATCLN
ncbi:MAG TPA: hypothetical protein PLV42_04995 [bacterium]|nr:hypothetical protein [bacterium]